MDFTIRIRYRVVRLDPVTSKPKVTMKNGAVFNIEATSRANAQRLIKEALKSRGITAFSIVPTSTGDTYIVYVR